MDLLSHVRPVLDQRNDVEVLVGSDSHNHGHHTVYTTTVVMRYWRNGAQVVYRRERAPKDTDLWTRLWGEVERSLRIAALLREEGRIPVRRIDMDLNSDARFGSHKLHTAVVGYIRSNGYEPWTKPEMLIASWAANVLGWFAEGARMQRAFARVMLGAQSFYFFLDVRTADWPLGNALYKGPGSLGPVVVGAIALAVWIRLNVVKAR